MHLLPAQFLLKRLILGALAAMIVVGNGLLVRAAIPTWSIDPGELLSSSAAIVLFGFVFVAVGSAAAVVWLIRAMFDTKGRRGI